MAILKKFHCYWGDWVSKYYLTYTFFEKWNMCPFSKNANEVKPWMLENFNFKFPVWYVCFFLTEKLSPSQLYVGLLRMWNSLVSFGRGSNTFTFLTLAANNLTYIFLKNNFWHRFPTKLSWLFFWMTSSCWIVCWKSLKIYFRLTFISVGQQSKPKKKF